MLTIIPSLLPKGRICDLGISNFLFSPGIHGSISTSFAESISAKEISNFLAMLINVSSLVVV